MAATLSIQLLGNPSVVLEEAPVRGFVSSKAAALLYYLAATGRPHSREALAGLLWPEVADAHALKNLRDVLSNLRRLLEPFLDITRQSVALAAGALVVVDSRAFEADLTAAGHATSATAGAALLRAAVARYSGDFLEGFSLADAPAFEQWALTERERLRQLVLNALQRLAAHAGHQGDYLAGIDYASRLVAIDPTREEAHRQLMLLLALSGQRGAALAQYAACRRVLDEELGIDPDEATAELHRRILGGEIVGQQPAPTTPAVAQPIYQLPAPRAALIGRAAEVARAETLLAERACRLITITGPGGIGKTRLALHITHRLVPASQRGEHFAHGVVFVGLAPVELAAAEQQVPESSVYPILAARVADALRFTFAGPDAPYEQLAGYLHEKDLLIVLDNCEHIPVAGFVVDLLERAPRLKLVITSRGRLNVRGEQVIELAGLDFPSQPELAAQAGARAYSALQLFRETAQSVNSRLEWAPAAAGAAAQICRLVAGHPLAIELAASLARLMPIQEIADEIAANLEFLQSTRRDLPGRHQSLRAVFEHSWKLLAPAEQQALRQLTIFRGGFSREAAAQVAGASLPLLAALVDNSLVRQIYDQEQASGRYELLELVRQYAAEQLTAAEPAALGERHGSYYLGFVCQRAADLRGSRQQAAAAEIHREIENIRAAWRWAIEQGQAELLSPASEGLFFFYEMRSWFREGAEVFGLAAAQLARICAKAPSPAAQVAWGQLLARQGWCAFQIGQPAEARALLQQSLAILEPLGDIAKRVLPLNYLASVAYYQGDYAAAEQVAAAALAASQSSGDRHGAAVALTVFGQIAALVGRYEDARRYSEESLAIERELGNRWGMVFPLISLGRVAQAQGNYRSAQRYFQEGLGIRQGFGDMRGVALCLQYLGDTADALADLPEANWFYHEALALFQAIGNRSGEVAALAKLGYNALSLQDSVAARAYFHRALAVAWDTQSTPRILEALAGVATALAGADPARAHTLGTLVRHHPAATQDSRERAAALLAGAAEQPGPEAAPPDLASVVEELLRIR